MAAVLIVLVLLAAVVVIVLLWAVATYNILVRARNEVKNAWAQIDVQLKRRHDLIPNLVETVKGYAAHERTTFENVTKARNIAMQAQTPAESGKAETALSNALGQLYVVVENYPQLKANENFMALQEELSSTENKIGFARQYYNDSVLRYNTSLQSVPTNVIAGMFHFTPADLFELQAPAEREAPQVKFP